MQQFVALMISTKDRFIQLKFIHRAYYMPQRLSVIYPTANAICLRCRGEVGNFMHMVWLCPVNSGLLEKVVSDIQRISRVPLTWDPLIFLLSITDNLPTKTHKNAHILGSKLFLENNTA